VKPPLSVTRKNEDEIAPVALAEPRETLPMKPAKIAALAPAGLSMVLLSGELLPVGSVMTW
jgi:hypothetical protein